MTGHVLVADGALTTRILLKAILTEAHYDVSLVGDSASAIGILRHNYPGVLILGQMLADGPGTALLEWVRARPDTRALPVIMLSDQANPQSRIDALSAGADEMMAKPISEATLLARLRSLLRAYDSETALDERAGAVHDMGFSEASPEFIGPARIGIVGPDIAQARDWADLMTPHLQDKLIPMTPDEALGTAPAALYILSAATDPASGLRQLADLRARAATRHAAIVLVHDPDDTATAVTALDLGANDLIAQPFDPREMALRLSIQLSRKYNDDRLRASVEDRLRLAVVDPLTGLFNRRYADAHTERVVSRAKDSGRSYAVILAAIGLIESLLTLNLVGDLTGQRGGASQECIAQGVANTATGFFGGMGGCAMIGQSMINVKSGGRTRSAGIVTCSVRRVGRSGVGGAGDRGRRARRPASPRRGHGRLGRRARSAAGVLRGDAARHRVRLRDRPAPLARPRHGHGLPPRPQHRHAGPHGRGRHGPASRSRLPPAPEGGAPGRSGVAGGLRAGPAPWRSAPPDRHLLRVGGRDLGSESRGRRAVRHR